MDPLPASALLNTWVLGVMLSALTGVHLLSTLRGLQILYVHVNIFPGGKLYG